MLDRKVRHKMEPGICNPCGFGPHLLPEAGREGCPFCPSAPPVGEWLGFLAGDFLGERGLLWKERHCPLADQDLRKERELVNGSWKVGPCGFPNWASLCIPYPSWEGRPRPPSSSQERGRALSQAPKGEASTHLGIDSLSNPPAPNPGSFSRTLAAELLLSGNTFLLVFSFF
jgi:hypothetical protein